MREAVPWAGGTPGAKEEGATRGWRGSRAGRSRPGSRVGGDPEPIVDLLNRGASVAGIAAREADGKPGVARKWRRNDLKTLKSAPGNGMASEASNPQDVVQGRAAERKNDKVGGNFPPRNLTKAPCDRRTEIVAALAERGGRRAPRFPSVDQAELTRSATASTAAAQPRGDREENYPPCNPLKNHKTGKCTGRPATPSSPRSSRSRASSSASPPAGPSAPRNRR